ncbi:hypothetical protein ACRALDRAFT_1075119 [Sodiomyces alcalophilus JCM 7366]|uniref:uncharacterized protein n=1 Tax=Sodiomyces alcalophilus JCM 7366 TaxID=591952 RepID=UPI0039B63AC6
MMYSIRDRRNAPLPPLDISLHASDTSSIMSRQPRSMNNSSHDDYPANSQGHPFSHPPSLTPPSAVSDVLSPDSSGSGANSNSTQSTLTGLNNNYTHSSWGNHGAPSYTLNSTPPNPQPVHPSSQYEARTNATGSYDSTSSMFSQVRTSQPPSVGATSGAGDNGSGNGNSAGTAGGSSGAGGGTGRVGGGGVGGGGAMSPASYGHNHHQFPGAYPHANSAHLSSQNQSQSSEPRANLVAAQPSSSAQAQATVPTTSSTTPDPYGRQHATAGYFPSGSTPHAPPYPPPPASHHVPYPTYPQPPSSLSPATSSVPRALHGLPGGHPGMAQHGPYGRPYHPYSMHLPVMPGSIMSNPLHNPNGHMPMMPGMHFAGYPHPLGHPIYGHGRHPQSLQPERPFKCDQCPTAFNRNHDLKRHKRIHLSVKPFPCDCCDKSFSRKDALKRHKLVKGCGQRKPGNGSDDADSSGSGPPSKSPGDPGPPEREL